MSGKVSKASVNYRPTGNYMFGKRKCGNCSMFVPAPAGNRYVAGRAGRACSLVAGVIRASDVCDRWAAKGGGR